MLLFGLLLLTSALAGQRHRAQAESNLSSKFQLSSNKEQNGESPRPAPPSRLAVCVSRRRCAVGRAVRPRRGRERPVPEPVRAAFPGTGWVGGYLRFAISGAATGLSRGDASATRSCS